MQLVEIVPGDSAGATTPRHPLGGQSRAADDADRTFKERVEMARQELSAL